MTNEPGEPVVMFLGSSWSGRTLTGTVGGPTTKRDRVDITARGSRKVLLNVPLKNGRFRAAVPTPTGPW